MKCGVDICETSRIKDAIEKLGNSFLKRVFSEKEIYYCESHNVTKFECYAARFAGKEAVYKALDVRNNSEDSFTEVEILKKENGRPYVVLHGRLKDYIKDKEIDISLSHEKGYAIAFCVIS